MPDSEEVLEFDGISIFQHVREPDSHIPHFHAIYAGNEVSWSIDTNAPLAGSLPRKQESKVRKWAKRKQVELMENWKRTRAGQHPNPIDYW